ncbi:hypothetical protein KV541_09135 [Halobacterium salinarum]|nr:hypothetical protein [Halobacterium salinarum]MCF2168314.1 hypothetical protein [Halobacterium salinarum]
MHVRFYDQKLLATIQETKARHNASWRQMIRYGARYLRAVEGVIDNNPDLIVQQILERTDAIDLPEHANTDHFQESHSDGSN